MRFASKVAVIAVALGAILAATGCHRKQAAKPVQPPARMSFYQATPDATVRLTLAPAIAPHTALRFKLYQDGVHELTAFITEARNDHDRVKAKGGTPRPYEHAISWTITAATPRLLSAWGTWFDYAGGAHPNNGSEALLWDDINDREVQRSELFRTGADQAPLDAALCQAIHRAKAERGGSAADQQGWNCPMWADSNFVFAPSVVSGKLGGLIFLFDPYAIGPYAEGTYEVTVPLDAFKSELAPAWAADFAGSPAASAPQAVVTG